MSTLRDLWDRFDRLSDMKKVATGSFAVLFLFSTWLYTLGFLGMVTMGKQAAAAPSTVEPTATVMLTATATPTEIATATATEYVPARLPTERPVVIPRPTLRPEPPRLEPTATRVFREPTPTRVFREPTSTPVRIHTATPTPVRLAPVSGTPEPWELTPTSGILRVVPTPTVPLLITPGLPPTATPGPAGLTLMTATPTVSAPVAPTPTRVPASPSPTPIAH